MKTLAQQFKAEFKQNKRIGVIHQMKLVAQEYLIDLHENGRESWIEFADGSKLIMNEIEELRSE